jgi:hypothetical protein
MKTCLSLVSISAAVLLLWCGCGGSKADVTARTSALEKAFPDLAAVAPAATDQAVPAGDPKAYVSSALSAVRRQDLATGVIMLKRALRLPGLTVDQIKAMQEARSMWMTDLTQRADKGDESAKAALAAISNAQ